MNSDSGTLQLQTLTSCRSLSSLSTPYQVFDRYQASSSHTCCCSCSHPHPPASNSCLSPGSILLHADELLIVHTLTTPPSLPSQHQQYPTGYRSHLNSTLRRTLHVTSPPPSFHTSHNLARHITPTFIPHPTEPCTSHHPHLPRFVRVS